MGNMLGKKTGGRQKGTPNKIKFDIEAFIAKVEKGSGKTLDEWLASTLMDRKTRVPILLQLLAFRYGKPKERLEVSGSVGVAQIIAEARARVASISSLPGPIKLAEPEPRPLLTAPVEPEILSPGPQPERDRNNYERSRIDGLPITVRSKVQ